jgi:hypothetical protein
MPYPMNIDEIIAAAKSNMKEAIDRLSRELDALPKGTAESPLSFATRQEVTKRAKHLAEVGKVYVRNARRDGLDPVKRLANAGLIAEQDLNRVEMDIFALTDHFIQEIQECLKSKEADLVSGLTPSDMPTPYVSPTYIGVMYVDHPFNCPNCGTAATSCTDSSGRKAFKSFYMRCPCTEAFRRKKDEEEKIRGGIRCASCRTPIHRGPTLTIESYLCSPCRTKHFENEARKNSPWGRLFG